MSRKSVRRVLRSGATEFRYERKRQPLPKLGEWQAELDKLLEANAARSVRERLTLVRLFEALREQGYAGGYDAVRRYARGWQRASASHRSHPTSQSRRRCGCCMSRWPIARATIP